MSSFGVGALCTPHSSSFFDMGSAQASPPTLLVGSLLSGYRVGLSGYIQGRFFGLQLGFSGYILRGQLGCVGLHLHTWVSDPTPGGLWVIRPKFCPRTCYKHPARRGEMALRLCSFCSILHLFRYRVHLFALFLHLFRYIFFHTSFPYAAGNSTSVKT